MKKAFFVIMVMVLVGMSVYSQTNTQWDFFKNVIPKQKSITIYGGSRYGPSWSMTINDKYIVTFSGKIEEGDPSNRIFSNSVGDNGTSVDKTLADIMNVSFNGTGLLIWDNEKIKIDMSVNGSGNYHQRSLITKSLSGGWKEVTAIRDWYASGNSSAKWVFILEPEYKDGKFSGKIKFGPYQTMTVNMSGNTSKSESITVGGGDVLFTATIVPKSESELNASSKDAFGEWKWNTDRSKLFLKSMNSNNNFVIWNKDGVVSWSMEMEKGAKGASESTTETGDKLVNLSMAFDGATVQVFSFIENKDAAAANPNIMQLDYAVYNRFLGTLDKKSDVILNQIKDKSMLILTYTVNGAQKTDMFLLEGLDTILEYLNKQ